MLVMGIGMLFQKIRWPMHRHPKKALCPMVLPMVVGST